MTPEAVADYVYDIAANAILSGENDAIRLFLELLLERDPQHLTLLRRIADFASQQRKYAAAIATLEHALAIDPASVEVHLALGVALEESGDAAGAQAIWRSDVLRGAVRVFPFTGSGRPVRVLTIASALHAIRYELFLDTSVMQNLTLYTQTYDPAAPLPEHDVILTAVADVESDTPALEVARAIVERSDAPVINDPARVLRTGRVEQAQRLRAIDTIVPAHIVTVACASISGPQGAIAVANRGFTFPLLLRSPGFHNGRFFELVAREADLEAAVASMPGADVMLIAYQDTRSADGNVRKYRAMSIDGTLYPIHLAISANWKVHYVTSDMHRNEAFRLEEAAFLDDMTAALGARVVRTLERVAAEMQLDYGGIDFGIAPDGRVVVFEANGAMAIFVPDGDPRWDYRRAAFARALDAVKAMIVARGRAHAATR